MCSRSPTRARTPTFRAGCRYSRECGGAGDLRRQAASMNVPSRSRERRVNGKGHPGDAESRMLDVIQREAFSYFAHETNRANGLVFDTNSGVAPSSIAAVGLGLTAYPVAVERGSSPAPRRRSVRSRRCGSFGEASRGPSRMPPGTAGSTITFSTCRPARACGSASFRRLIPRCCSAEC